MKLTHFFSSKILLTLAAIAPSALILAHPMSVQALPVQNLDRVTDSANQEARPFIDSGSRYDSIDRLQQRGTGIFQQDGGTGKESSDDKKKESKDGKEQCESGNCGGLIIPNGQERINPADRNLQFNGIKMQSALPSQLLSSQQPII